MASNEDISPKKGGLERIPYRDFDYPLIGGARRSGVWAAGAESFFVDEIPLYPFSGAGEHAALTIEKKGTTTRDLAVAAGRILGVDNAAIGYAGMKDKDATTTQAFTVLHPSTDRAAKAFEEAGARVIDATRHGNKLRLGHLAGNRFRALIRGGEAAEAQKTLAVLEKIGAPNFFGPQRFGAEGKNALDGLAYLKGSRRGGRFVRDLAVSALQSYVFNEILARRIELGTFKTALLGDVMQKTDSGGLFLCAEPAEEQARLDAGAIVPTGPMHGSKMKEPQSVVLELEEAVLEGLGLSSSLFSRETGTRRALAFRILFPSAEETEGGVFLSFAAPAGCFATSVIREIAASGVFRTE